MGKENKENPFKLFITNKIFNRVNLFIIIIALLICLFWIKKDESINLGDFISLSSGLVSIALAFVAIIIAVGESIKTSNTERRTDTALEEVIKNVKTMSSLIESLKKEQKKLVNKTDLTYSFIEKIKEFYQNGKPTIEPVEPVEPVVPVESVEPKTKKTTQNVDAKNHSGLYKRGDLFFADLSPVLGSEQGGTRPVLIISNDIGNRFSPTVGVAAITAQIQKAKLPTHVEIKAHKHNFERDSVILLEQVRTIDKSRLLDRIAQLDSETMEKVDTALLIQYGLVKF